MPKVLNWKSVSLLAAIAGVLVPIWIWRTDLNSKSVSFRVASQVALQPQSAGGISGLQVTIDSIPLRSPYLSVLTLTNDGDKPIPSSDYETAIELHVEAGATVARAQVTAATPKDLSPMLSWDQQVLRIQPLLLNPDDSISISILTAGSSPKFLPRARIAGVASVRLVEAASQPPNWMLRVLLLSAAVLLFVASDVTNEGLFGRKPIILRRRSAILVSSLTGAIGVSTFMLFLDNVGIREVWQIVLYIAGLLLFTGILAAYWNSPPKPNKALSNGNPP